MKKGQLSEKMMSRFPRITKFIEIKKRFPTNREIAKMFDVASGGIGETTKDIIDKYKKSLTYCTVCGHRLKNKKTT